MILCSGGYRTAQFGLLTYHGQAVAVVIRLHGSLYNGHFLHGQVRGVVQEVVASAHDELCLVIHIAVLAVASGIDGHQPAILEEGQSILLGPLQAQVDPGAHDLSVVGDGHDVIDSGCWR